MKFIMGVVIGILAAGFFVAGIIFGPKLTASVPSSAELAPVIDKVAAADTESRSAELKAAQADFQTQLAESATQLKASVDALAAKVVESFKVVEEGQKAISTRLETNEERLARTERLYEELKAAQVSESAAPPESAVPPTDDQTAEVVEDEIPAAEADRAVIWLDNIAGACPKSDLTIDQARLMTEEGLRNYLSDCLAGSNFSQESLPEMVATPVFNIHDGPDGKKLTATHPKDQCLPPRKLVRTDTCWPIGGTKVRCKLACQ